MELRDFLYLNEKILNSYISTIDGGLHDTETVIEMFFASQKCSKFEYIFVAPFK